MSPRSFCILHAFIITWSSPNGQAITNRWRPVAPHQHLIARVNVSQAFAASHIHTSRFVCWASYAANSTSGDSVRLQFENPKHTVFRGLKRYSTGCLSTANCWAGRPAKFVKVARAADLHKQLMKSCCNVDTRNCIHKVQLSKFRRILSLSNKWIVLWLVRSNLEKIQGSTFIPLESIRVLFGACWNMIDPFEVHRMSSSSF